jgi:hypothetical protein
MGSRGIEAASTPFGLAINSASASAGPTAAPRMSKLRAIIEIGTTPEFWMNLQGQYELETARLALGDEAAKINRRRAAA